MPPSGSVIRGSSGLRCYGLDPEAHLRRCRELAADGYRPVSLSGSRDDARRRRRSWPRSGTGRW